jgi:hypothetical protein
MIMILSRFVGTALIKGGEEISSRHLGLFNE